MTNFVWNENVLARLPALITERLPRFQSSRRYTELDADTRDIPGVVLAALGCYLRDLYEEDLGAATLGEAQADERRATLALVEELARTPNTDVRSLVRDELLENVEDASAEILAQIRRDLGPAARQLWT
jgi:hypothetical protein